MEKYVKKKARIVIVKSRYFSFFFSLSLSLCFFPRRIYAEGRSRKNFSAKKVVKQKRKKILLHFSRTVAITWNENLFSLLNNSFQSFRLIIYTVKTRRLMRSMQFLSSDIIIYLMTVKIYVWSMNIATNNAF